MKNKNNDSEVVTQGVLRETFRVALDDVVTKISAKIDEKIDTAIGDLAIMVEKGFQGMTEQMNDKFEQVDKRFEKIDKRFEQIDRRFDKITSELKDIHKEIGVNELKTRGDVAGLDFRMGKVEKKVGIS
jgi:chaperonin cofactor prefoldin